MPGTALTLWTIRLAAAAFILVLGLKCSSSTAISRAHALRWIWSVGCALAILHFVSAMTFYHEWSLTAAHQDTAEKTQAAIGWRFGGGIYFNYLFLLIWLADAIWWWIAPAGYANRGKVVNLLVYGYLFFIAFNGVVVFGQGATHWTGLGVCLVFVVWAGWQGLSKRQRRANPREQSIANRID